MKRKFLFLIMLLLLPIFFNARLHYEKVYQNKVAEMMDGNTETVLEDGTRVDILTDDYAIEVDFADKWAEGIGQCLHYSLMTGKKAGLVLIAENVDKDEKYIVRALNVAKNHNIKVWVIDSSYNVVEFYLNWEVKGL